MRTNYTNRWRHVNTWRYNIAALVRSDWSVLPQLRGHLIIEKALLIAEQIVRAVIERIVIPPRCKQIVYREKQLLMNKLINKLNYFIMAFT